MLLAIVDQRTEAAMGLTDRDLLDGAAGARPGAQVAGGAAEEWARSRSRLELDTAWGERTGHTAWGDERTASPEWALPN